MSLEELQQQIQNKLNKLEQEKVNIFLIIHVFCKECIF